MIAGVFFHEDARKEFDEAADFYSMEQPALGAAFVEVVEQAVARISEYPESSPILSVSLRWPTIADAPTTGATAGSAEYHLA